MLTRAAKDEQIKEFNEAFKTNPSVMVVEYKGLSVSEMEKLRKDVRDAQAELKVVKNTLLRIAAKDTDIEQIEQLFEGPTAVAICESDPSAVAKVFVDTVKEAPLFKVKGGFVDGSVMDGNAISELSKLPSRPELIAEFMGLLNAPMSNVVGVLTQLQTKLLYALEALKETKDAVKEEEPQTEAAPEVSEEAPKEAVEGAEEASEEAAAEDKEEVKEAPEEPAEAKTEQPQESEPIEDNAQEQAAEASSESEAEETQEAPQEAEPQASEEAGGQEQAQETEEASDEQSESSDEVSSEDEEEK